MKSIKNYIDFAINGTEAYIWQSNKRIIMRARSYSRIDRKDLQNLKMRILK